MHNDRKQDVSEKELPPASSHARLPRPNHPRFCAALFLGILISIIGTILLTYEVFPYTYNRLHYAFFTTTREIVGSDVWIMAGTVSYGTDDHELALLTGTSVTDNGQIAVTGFMAFTSSAGYTREVARAFALLTTGWLLVAITWLLTALRALMLKQWRWFILIVASLLAFVIIGTLSAGHYQAITAPLFALGLILDSLALATGPLLFAFLGRARRPLAEKPKW